MAIPYERIVTEDLDPGWTRVPLTMPAGGVAYGRQINAQSFPGTPWLNAELFGARADGLHDDAPAIQAALDLAGVTGTPYTVWLPSGTLKLGSTLTLPPAVTLRGQGTSTVLKPTAAVTTCVVMGSGSALERVLLEGVLTTGCVGISVGLVTLVSNLFIRDIEVWRFTGSGAMGLQLAQGVTFACYDSYFCQNEYNLVTGSLLTGTPTNSMFLNCQFREAVHRGVWIQGANSLLFLSCLFESNQEEGLYIGAPLGLNALDVRIWGCWFENDWNSLALGAARDAVYECVVNGTGAGTVRPEFRSSYFNGSAATARSLHFITATDFLVDHVKVFNEAANILVDVNSYGTFVNWPGQNGAYRTTVSGVTSALTNTESEVTDVIEAGWASWTPTVTGTGGMTITGLSVVRARWKQIGKVVHVSVQVNFTTVAPAGVGVNVTLPAGLAVPTDQASYWLGFTYNPATNDLVPILVRLTSAPPSLFATQLAAGGVWIVGGGEVTVNATFEVT
jgi:hypothetical protein